MAVSFRHGNEPLVFAKGEKLFDYLKEVLTGSENL